ncbi:hypothetical protein DVH24_030763 [Malus domestica]|uniref:Uncharacterized protein n=1 Tax=Malus domestica TaxID=3750 RepID=A0A498HCD5_MALDO|nr:hypothetical protein DVH24_030763 [Malus domestica]
MAAGTRAIFAPCISEDLLLRVQSLLYAGVSVETIMQRHDESVEKQGGPSNRDDLLTYRVAVATDDLLRQSQPYSFLIQVFVQKQLSGLVNLESNDTTMNVASFANRDQGLVNEDPINEEVLSPNANNCGNGDVAAERTKDDARTNPTGFEDDILNRNSQENTMDKDMNILSSTMEFVEQCKVTHPDDYHSHDIDPAVICKTSVESQVVEAAETLGVITENDRMETENKNRSTINHSSSADDTASIDGPCDNLVNASACSRDSKAVGNMMVVQYSRSSYNEEQLRN